MLLVVDTGNTNTLFAVHDGQEWRAQWRTSTNTTRTADEYIVWLTDLMRMRQLTVEEIDACIISSVVPQSLFHLRNLCRRHLQLEPVIVGPEVNIGIGFKYPQPHEVGADRLVNALGAHLVYPGDLIIIDSGTATTFDVVDRDGDFCGGIISPGINLSMQALHDAAAQLPRVAIQMPAHTIGQSTVEAMQSGVYWGYVCLIEGLIARIREEWGQPMTVIATGGVASLFEDATGRIDHFDPDLTIRGLLEIYNRNQSA